MNISIVIICRDDPHIFETIDSIDTDVPIIVSLVSNKELEAGLQARGVEIIGSPPGNCSISYNRGLRAIRTDRVFVVDSDCTLAPQCLTFINEGLDKNSIVRAKVNYEFSQQLFWSEPIAQFRDIINNSPPVPAYMPGLGFHMDIVSALGGYFFDERLFWASDSELSKRVKRAGLQVTQLPDAIISHAPVSLSHELFSGFKHGMGTRAQVKLNLRPPYENPDWLFKRFLGWLLRRPAQHRKMSAKLSVRLTSFVWMLAFYVGYYRVFFRNAEKIGTLHR